MIKTFAGFFLLIFSFSSSMAQEGKGFSQILQTYYLHPDKYLLNKTVAFLNDPNQDEGKLQPILTGFFGALFAVEPNIRKEFAAHLDQFEQPQSKRLMTMLCNSDIDSIYANTPLSPSYNDMNWSSYFATGNLKYVERILTNVKYAEERVDLNLFLTGATAKWSLSSNARQDKKVHEYLTGLKENKKAIKEMLKKDSDDYQTEMVKIIREQRAKGLWK